MPTAGGFAALLGIGDDAAAWRPATGIEVATTDTVVEGTHFTRETAGWADAGWKLWAANVSDVAAMGGTPLAGLVTLGIPADLPVAAIDALYDGMIEACAGYGTYIAGGDIVGSPTVFVTVALTGVCAGEPVTRSAAKPGEVLAVSGPLGGSAGGLRVLQEGVAADAARDVLVRMHRRPEPSVQAGQALVNAGLRCAMDVSDGLVADVGKMALASGVGVTIEAWHVPQPPELATVFPDDATELALTGGEDYRLLFTGSWGAVERAMASMPGAAVVGIVTEGVPGTVEVMDQTGAPVSLPQGGWEHLQ